MATVVSPPEHLTHKVILHNILPLGAGEYVSVEESATFPGVTRAVSHDCIEAGKRRSRTDWQRRVRAWVHNRRAHLSS